VIGPAANAVDRENRFPEESVGALREIGAFRYGLPRELSGWDFDFREFCQLAAIVGERCLSTAVIWAMHCQQLLTFSSSGIVDDLGLLERVAGEQCLCASVTTEIQKGGDLLRTHAPLVREDGRVVVKRRAPIVSYGREAEYFLLTMRSAEQASNTCLVVVTRRDGTISEGAALETLGMRGTQSLSMTFDVNVPASRIVPGDFLSLAQRSMIPAGHLGWASGWYGAAKGLTNSVIRWLRRSASQDKKPFDSDALRLRLGEIRADLDLVQTLIEAAADRLQALRTRNAPAAAYADPTLNILVNNVKVCASRRCFAVVDALVEIVGLFEGYLAGSETGLERYFRDLRSATLMYKNDRLLDANGRLVVVEPMQFFRRGFAAP
jgi:acyl-CoA dehydrogenase